MDRCANRVSVLCTTTHGLHERTPSTEMRQSVDRAHLSLPVTVTVNYVIPIHSISRFQIEGKLKWPVGRLENDMTGM